MSLDSLPQFLLLALEKLDGEAKPTRQPEKVRAVASKPDRDNPPGPDRVLVYAWRSAAGLALWHPDDLHRRELAGLVVQETHRRRNGSDAEGDWRLQYEASEPDDGELEDEAMAARLFRAMKGGHGA